jgi:uncharacterized sodium:solute symporter family permease YidK
LSITRAKTSSIAQGPSTNRNLLAGNPVILPGSYESIQTITVGAGGQTTITFSSIPSTYKHLQIRGMARGTDSSLRALFLSINSTVNVVRSHYLYGNGGTASAGSQTANQIGWSIGSGQLASAFSVAVIDILDYANTNKNKVTRCLAANDLNGSGDIALFSELFDTTAAINAVNLTLEVGNFVQHSSFALYGIK